MLVMILDVTFHKTNERGLIGSERGTRDQDSLVLICALENGLAVRNISSYI